MGYSAEKSLANSKMPGSLDVVTVPDFRPAQRASFTGRTLFFLASWLERAGGRTRASVPLRLACIGEPPESVRSLAAQARAIVTVHEPVHLNRSLTANKLRGLETGSTAERILLLDTDILVLRPFERGLRRLPPNGLAAAPASYSRVPDDYWRAIYRALDLPPPTERMLSVQAESGLHSEVPMSPYYNSGVLVVPRDCGLREHWEYALTVIGDLFGADAASAVGDDALPLAPRAITASDQAGLAAAMHRLRLEGWAVHRLPDALHVRPPHFASGTMRFASARLFHAVHFLRRLEHPADTEAALEAYLERWTSQIKAGWLMRHPRFAPLMGRVEARRAAQFLHGLWQKHVRPALQRD